MAVGEAPGAREDMEGVPFVGPAGQLLEEMMMQVGINPSDVFFTNLAKHRPPRNELSAWFDSAGNPSDPLLFEGLAELKAEFAPTSSLR
jgi:hypothetical protein